jgi:hypothetical protein
MAVNDNIRNPHAPLRRPPHKPGEVEKPEIPETEAGERDFIEGQIPGMPVSRDPLLHPGPIPRPTDVPPQD